MKPNKPALIIIDIQKGFEDPKWGKRNNPQAEKNIAKLLAIWRNKNLPIFHIKNDSTEKNSPLRPELPGNAFKEIVTPMKNEPVLIKKVNSSFIGTNLEKRLKKQQIENIVVVGLTTDHCVSTTVRMADNLGFNVWIVSDATATFNRTGFNGKNYSAEHMHQLALVQLQDEFATVVDTNYFL